MINCPICDTGIMLPDEEQPQAGTHAYTVVYDCGTEVDYTYGDIDYEEVSHKCTDGKKISMDDRLEEMMSNKKKKDFSSLTFKIQSFPQTHIAMMHEYTGYMLKAMEESETFNDRGYNTITAPELMVAVMKGCRGSANPMVVQELIKQLHRDS